MKRILSLLLTLCVLTGCNQGLTKMVGIRHSGDVVTIEGQSGSQFHIKSLNLKSDGKYFYLQDYIYDKNGKNYAITDWKNTQIGSVKLTKKEYRDEEKARIDVATLGSSMLCIGNELKQVELYSSSSGTKQLFVAILPRETSLELILNDIHLKSETGIPCIVSYSDADIAVQVKGDVSISGTKGLISQDALSQYDELKNYCDDMVNNYVNERGILSIYTALTHVLNVNVMGTWVAVPAGSVALGYLVCTYVVVKSAVSLHQKGVEGFVNDAYKFMETTSNKLLEMTQKTWDLLMSKAGTNGTDGSDTVVIPGGISFKGDGHLSIYGAGGTNGTDAKQMLNAAPGGNGGNGGSAVNCCTYANIMDKSKYTIAGGPGGTGGKGATNLIGSTKYNNDGKTGSTGADVSALHKFVK